MAEAESRQLRAGGHSLFEKTECEIEYIGEKMTVIATSFSDEYQWRLAARIKSLAVSMGLVPRYIWEVALWGDKDPIPGLPVAVKMR